MCETRNELELVRRCAEKSRKLLLIGRYWQGHNGVEVRLKLSDARIGKAMPLEFTFGSTNDALVDAYSRAILHQPLQYRTLR
jgi:hypothetical protein